jgi:hypothetical protein
MKTTVVIVGLLLILLANMIMIYFAPYGISPMEGFANDKVAAKRPMPKRKEGFQVANAPAPSPEAAMNSPVANAAATAANMPTQESTVEPEANVDSAITEGFASSLDMAGGAKDMYEPIGSFDGVKLKTGNSVSSWRYTAPNESLTGPEFAPGPDSLFMFKNNQCKPECCGASFSCGGGCVCTTPQQRQYIAARGGNRTAPEDSA